MFVIMICLVLVSYSCLQFVFDPLWQSWKGVVGLRTIYGSCAVVCWLIYSRTFIGQWLNRWLAVLGATLLGTIAFRIVVHILFIHQLQLGYAYPNLVRPHLEQYRAQFGVYPPTLQHLHATIPDTPFPPAILNPDGNERVSYKGWKERFYFGMDWGFLGPLGADYHSEEGRWRNYS